MMSRPGFPSIPSQSSPNRRLKPMRINTTVPMQKSIRFFIRMFPVFLALVKPASHIAKPACIQNTNAAPIRNQTLKTSPLTRLMISSIFAPTKKIDKGAKPFRSSAFALHIDYHSFEIIVNMGLVILCFIWFYTLEN